MEVGRIDILPEVSLMSTHLALPLEVHMEQVLQIFGYLKIHKKMRLMFDSSYPIMSFKIFNQYDWFDFYRYSKEDISPNMPESRGHIFSISIFVDAGIARDKSTRQRQTVVLVFINKAPIHWYINRHSTAEASTFGAEFCSMNSGVDMVEYLSYNTRMFGVPIDGSANGFYDNKSIYNNTITP